MSTLLKVKKKREIEYPTTSSKYMPESSIHRDVITYLLQVAEELFSTRNDIGIHGDLMLYYEEGNPSIHVAPDFFLAFGVPKKERGTYKVWEEGKAPDLIVEVTSKNTRKVDVQKKVKLYQDVLKVKEYFLFDPEERYLSPSLREIGRAHV